MSHFTDQEVAYLSEQRLGRLATVDGRGRPHVAPVGFSHDPETDTIVIGGHNFGASKKYRDARDQQVVAFVVDDLASTDPWQPRGVEIRGVASADEHRSDPQRGFDAAIIRITPTRIIGWGLDTDAFAPNSRDIDTSTVPGVAKVRPAPEAGD